MESHQLRKQKIHKTGGALEALVYRAKKVSATKRRLFQVRPNWARQVAPTWSDADRQKAIELLECEIHHVTPAKRKLFNKVFQRHERQRLQEVGTKATGPRSKFAKELALMKTAADDEAYRAANMTADKPLPFQVRLSDAETEATTWSLADTKRVTSQLEREIYGITLNEQMRFKTEFSIRLIEFETWCENIGIQALRNTIEQCVIHFGYPKMHLVSHISERIQRMRSGDNYTTDIYEWLHITNVKEAYWSSNKVNYIQQMLKHNDKCTGVDNMEETQSHLALDGWYDIDSTKGFNLLATTDKRWSTWRAHLLGLLTSQDEPIIHPVSLQLYHLRETHVHGVCRSIKLTSLRDASEDFGIPNFGQLLRAQIKQDCGHEVSGLVLGYDQNLLIDSMCIKLQNGLLYYRPQFQYPTSVERLGLDFKVEYVRGSPQTAIMVLCTSLMNTCHRVTLGIVTWHA